MIHLKTNIPGNNIAMQTDIFPILSKNIMLAFFSLFLIILDVTINSNNFNTIINMNHTGIMLKYANVANDKIVYNVSDRISSFAPMFVTHFNFLARKPSAISDSIITANASNKIQFFKH
jgi:hypothetical protein